MRFKVKIIHNMEGFISLKNEWDDLILQHSSYQPFLDYDWFQIWLEHFNRYHRLFIIVFTENNQTKLICPFGIVHSHLYGVAVKKLELIGNIYSPVRNFIYGSLTPGDLYSAITDLFDFLSQSRSWNLLDLNSLPEEDLLLDIIERVLVQRDLKYHTNTCFSNYYLDNISFSSDHYFRQLPKTLRYNIKKSLRDLKRQGYLQFKMITGSDNLDHYMDAYYHVYEKSWKKSEMDPTFHRDLAKKFARKKCLRLAFLLLDNNPIATGLRVVHNGVAYFMKSAFNEAYRKFRPGTLLNWEVIRYLLDEDDVQEIDYLIGDERYKRDWLPNRRDRRGVCVFQPNLKGNALFILESFILPILRKSRLLRAAKNNLLTSRHDSNL